MLLVQGEDKSQDSVYSLEKQFEISPPIDRATNLDLPVSGADASFMDSFHFMAGSLFMQILFENLVS